jgi:hypothetical protein
MPTGRVFAALHGVAPETRLSRKATGQHERDSGPGVPRLRVLKDVTGTCIR